MTPRRKLLAAWLAVGMVPFVLQVRGYFNFAIPHQITTKLLVPPGAEPKTDNLLELCPLKGIHVGQVWWNVEMTHYYALDQGNVCHFVIPQYNSHGNVLMGSTKVEAYRTAPSSCDNESYPVEIFIYHGSVGYFSFLDQLVSTYCTLDNTAYSHVLSLGTFDINGASLARELGGEGYRWSYWYCIGGAMWIIYRGLVLRRCFVICQLYGAKCDQMGVNLLRKQAMIFVHENLRLSAHEATNYHRVLLLYFFLEGLMSDLFLVAATDSSFIWLQYVSLGYNLSGILLLLFEMVESMGWLREDYRLFVKRLIFSYEPSLLGELVSAIWQSNILTSLNKSDLNQTKVLAVAASYYLWGLVGHGAIALVLISFIVSVRILRAVTYVRWKHGRVYDIFWAPCCVDTTYGVRNKMTKLGALAGYHWRNGKLYYKPDALKSFGLLRMEEEDGKESLVLNKHHWFEVRTDDLVVIGSVAEERVEPCSERPCTGVISFFDRNLGGPLGNYEGSRSITCVRSKVLPSPSSLSIIQT
ncbi:hypothetical protein PHYSODRAFT_523206 [Phytophthora sojae]|uniref:Uncharacterized protein n=1 Tax=Phytophthora sojae (strain P6497) TaxID=1094619 RepID=G5A549_PHYSP|nr:hypothetical protein PHYSODRAFT_523206 [Phytophthora sojae]EGZ09798.1 hypothetical protein PHYSODRAFT_523206 [Phytophthora sojae]|eukprot:XP_009534659.1 hypothetical protein PHYSODRAFT_523206 [Phytophthora sojae]